MSEQMRASEYKCPTCGRLDPFNQTIEDALRAEVERLQAELEKYTGPLTLVQIDDVDVAVGGWFKAGPIDLDAAIRAAREGER